MLSVPPASTTRDSPSMICCAACATASKPEPQSRFTVTRGGLDREPGPKADVAGEVGGVGGGLEDVAEDHVVHLGGRDPGPGQGRGSGHARLSRLRRGP